MGKKEENDKANRVENKTACAGSREGGIAVNCSARLKKGQKPPTSLPFWFCQLQSQPRADVLVWRSSAM